MNYIKGLKYQLVQPITIDTGITGYKVKGKFYRLNKDGILTIHLGFAWNGADVIPDREEYIAPSCVHDVLCLMIARKEIDKKEMKTANNLFIDMCKARKASKFKLWFINRYLKKYWRGDRMPDDREILTTI